MFTVLPAFRLTLCATGVALLALPLASRSQTAPAVTRADETTLNAVTVVGNWLEAPNEEKVLEHPGARTIVDRRPLSRRAPITCATC
jgi:Fe(3+) dicitrate transport protein